MTTSLCVSQYEIIMIHWGTYFCEFGWSTVVYI